MNNAARSLAGTIQSPSFHHRETSSPLRRHDHRESTVAKSADGDLLTLEEAAVAAGVSVRTLARYRKAGSLAVVKVGRRVLCSLDAVRDAMVKKGPQSIGRDLVGAQADAMPLGEWWSLAVQLAEEAPSFGDAQQVNDLAHAVLDRHERGSQAGRFRVGDLRSILSAEDRRGVDVWSFVLLYPDSMPVVGALRAVHDRFRW